MRPFDPQRPVPQILPRACHALPGILLAATLALTACSDDRTAFAITDAWVQAPGAHLETVGGFTVHNRTDEARTLQRVDAEGFENTRIQAGDSQNPSPPATVVVAGTGTLTLAPPGTHLRLASPQRTLRTGDRILLTLHFDGARVMFVNAEIRTAPPASPDATP